MEGLAIRELISSVNTTSLERSLVYDLRLEHS